MFGALVGFNLLKNTVNEAFSWAKRRKSRAEYFDMARKRADELRRPLVVIGDPEALGHQNIYGPGDLCIDLTGCPSYGGKGVRADISKGIPLPDNSAVIYVSYVLELIPDIKKAWNEILRVAGGPENVFVLHLQPNTFAARLYPGVSWVIESAPPVTSGLVYQPAMTQPSRKLFRRF